MNQGYYEVHKESSPLGIRILYQTIPGGFYPLHWHDELELLYSLNGDAELLMEGKSYHLPRKHLTVIESRQAHSNLVHGDAAMNICVHISKNKLKSYLPDIELYEIVCIPEQIQDEQFSAYYEICRMMAQLTKLYVMDAPGYNLESEGLVLQILSHLLRNFAVRREAIAPDPGQMSASRIYQVLSWVEEHYQEHVSLTDVSDIVCVSREYFCRLFKKNMGITFQQYLDEVRLNHVYQDLLNTDDPVLDIMENNGFTNQKRFHSSFKKLYGCTPSQVRKK